MLHTEECLEKQVFFIRICVAAEEEMMKAGKAYAVKDMSAWPFGIYRQEDRVRMGHAVPVKVRDFN